MNPLAWGRFSLLALLPAHGCSCQRSAEETIRPSAAVATPDEPVASAASHSRAAIDLTRTIDNCSFGHKGVLIDVGDPSTTAALHPGSLHAGADERVEHQGASWLRVRSRVLSVAFYWPAVAVEAPEAAAYVEARVTGGAARGASVTIDGRMVGTWAFRKGETRLVVARTPLALTLAPGGHELAIRFAGGARAGGDAFADVDWIHVGTGDPGELYAAPTRADVLVDASVEGRSVRALSLHAPGFARCSFFVPADATLETFLATAGGTDADVEALVVRDRRPPVVLGTAHVTGGERDWAAWSVPIAGLDGPGALASVELVAKRAAKGTRVLFGQPRVVRAAAVQAVAPTTARGVVIVVLGGTSAKALAPWGGPHEVPELASLAAAGSIGLLNRAPSSLASSVVASLLTGLPPARHGLNELGRSLADDVTTLQDACRQGGVATAMFTADPTTGAAFGFARGWDTFESQDPFDDAPGTRIFEKASAWIGAHGSERFLVVVHARGGHPPWDASLEELKEMPPAGYVGIIDPRRAAEALAKVRRHPARFKEDDRVRAWALYDHAIDQHDRALGQMLGALQVARRDNDVLTIVTGDVAANEASGVPFAETDTLDEPLLATPLVVRWARGSALAGRNIETATSPIDIARTVLGAFGLAAPAAFQGVDLAELTQGTSLPGQRPLMADRGDRFSVRWGPYVLMGSHEREFRMCDLSLDPACIADVRGTSPLALESIRRYAAEALGAEPRAPRPRVTLDEHTRAAWVRWGLEE